MESLATSLMTNLRKNWREWMKASPEAEISDLCVMLVADSRTVLFIMQSTTETASIYIKMNIFK